MMDKERLITEVQKYPELYDPQSSYYKDNVRKEMPGLNSTQLNWKWMFW